MEWTLAGLFGVSALLLIISISKSFQASKAEQKRIDMSHISIMQEINHIQDTIRNMELEIEIVMRESGIQLSKQEMTVLMEILDLYKRNYSIETIAEKKQVPASEIERLLLPYQSLKDGRGAVAHEI